MGFGVWGLGFGVWGLGFGVRVRCGMGELWGLGCLGFLGVPASLNLIWGVPKLGVPSRGPL